MKPATVGRTSRRPFARQAAAKPLYLALLLCAALLLSGCVTLHDPETSQVNRGEVAAVLQDGETAVQTFTARRANLANIQVWLRPAGEVTGGSVTFTLYRSLPGGGLEAIVQIPIAIEYIARTHSVNLGLPDSTGPAGQGYALEIRPSGTPVELLGRAEEAYAPGELVVNGAAVDADLAFHTSYRYTWRSLLEDLGAILGRLWLALTLALVLWLPGRLLLRVMRPGDELDWGARVAVSLGLSLAVIPVVMTWTTLLGLGWTRTALWAAAGVLLILLLAPAVQQRKVRQALGFVHPLLQRPSLPRSVEWTQIALAAVFLVALMVRMAMVRDLAAPPWVDPVHHGLLVRLIMEAGGFPSSYAPYILIETANYHSGFHSALAAFTWLSGLEIPDSMLLYGQVLNALMVFPVYLFTTLLVNDRRAGVIAALIAGLITPMPAYYTSWGRYTQLGALAILPAAAALLAALREPGAGRWKRLLLAGLVCGGLFLVHYRVIAFLALLLVAWFIVQVTADLVRRRPLRPLLEHAGWILLAAVAAVAFTLPWWPDTVRTLLIPKLAWGEASSPAFGDFSWNYLTSALGDYALALAGLGLIWSLVQGRRFGVMLVIWVGLLFVLANPSALGLPGGGFVNNTSVEITLFMPLAALGGYFLSALLGIWEKLTGDRLRPLYLTAATAAGAAAAVLGAQTLLPILNPVTLLVRQADRPALRWVAENIPAGEPVLINSFSWGYGLYAGLDGGAWIPAAAGRPTLPAPVLYGLGERDYILSTTGAARRAVESGADPDGLYQLMQEEGVRYVFAGAKGGSLSPRRLAESPLFNTLYARDGVWVFETAAPTP